MFNGTVCGLWLSLDVRLFPIFLKSTFLKINDTLRCDYMDHKTNILQYIFLLLCIFC